MTVPFYFFTFLLVCFLMMKPATVLAQPQLEGPLPEPLSDAEFAVLAGSFEYDPGRQLNVSRAKTCANYGCKDFEDHDSHSREKMVFTGWDGDRVPAYLALPKRDTAPYPIVILQYGMNGAKEIFWDENRTYNVLREELVKAGFAVVVPDVPFHGERLHENDFSDPPSLILSGQFEKLRDMSIRAVIEHRQILDYLATRDDIDTSKIASLGFSQGAMHTLYLSAVDSRIKAAVVWATPLRKNYPALYPGHFARQVKHADVLMLAGERDPFYKLEEARELYGLIPHDRKEFVSFGAGHQLREQEIPKVVEWLENRLGKNK